MAFGMNRVERIGRLGADLTVNHLMSGARGQPRHRDRRVLHQRAER